MKRVNKDNYEQIANELTKEQCLQYLAEKDLSILQFLVADDLYAEAEHGEFDFYPENLEEIIL